MKRSYAVYQILNKETRKVYIGMSKQYKKRWKHHKARLRNGDHGNPELQFDYDDGATFVYSIILTNLTFEEAEHYEKFFIEVNKGNLYNIVFSGKGRAHSEETIRKISESRKGKMLGKDNHFYNKKHTEESIQKMKESLKKIDRTGGNNSFAKKVYVNGKVYGSVKEGMAASGYKKYTFYKKLRDENNDDIRYVS